MSIGLWVLVIVGGAAGFISTMYIMVSLFVVIFYKLFRKIKHGVSMFE